MYLAGRLAVKVYHKRAFEHVDSKLMDECEQSD